MFLILFLIPSFSSKSERFVISPSSLSTMSYLPYRVTRSPTFLPDPTTLEVESNLNSNVFFDNTTLSSTPAQTTNSVALKSQIQPKCHQQPILLPISLLFFPSLELYPSAWCNIYFSVCARYDLLNEFGMTMRAWPHHTTREPSFRSMPISFFVSWSDGHHCSPQHARHAGPTICVL